ncbi:hypothetical protein BJX61DRAFT_338772 [Aspergillus egyptiacus]|nr:hypothetical protein BJX61DRAFT_338772 [Aspergillus egyptiacus]
MAASAVFWSAVFAFVLVLPRASAWTLLWRNETTPSEIITGQSERNCTRIWHQEGEQFSFDPEGPWCLKFYSDPQCQRNNGITCEGHIWRQIASQNISAFNVYAMPPESRTVFGLTSTSETPTLSSTSTSTAIETPSPTAPEAEQTPTAETSSDTSGTEDDLSGGAIAGIVIGVFVAVAFLCGACFYLGRRTGRKAAAAAAAAAASTAPTAPTDSSLAPRPGTNTDPASGDLSSSAGVHSPPPHSVAAELPKPPALETTEYSPPPVAFIQPPNGVRIIELPGQDRGAELSNTRQVQELEGRGMEKSAR